MTIHLCEDREQTVEHVAWHFVTSCRRAIAGRGRFLVALAGGSTPEPVYRELASIPDIDWPAVEVFFTDERCVPPFEAASNFRMVREALLDHVPLRPEAVHRIVGEIHPDEAARICGEEIYLAMGDDMRFDLVLLGIGEDGHVASLFPDTPDLPDDPPVAVATRAPTEPRDRVSLTLATILAARNVALLTMGTGKADVVRRVLLTPEGLDLPAGLVADGATSLDWFLDQDAASELELAK